LAEGDDIWHDDGHWYEGLNDLVNLIVSDIAIFVLKRDVKLQLTNVGVNDFSELWFTFPGA